MIGIKFSFALRFLWRNWRSGEVKILAGSLVLAVMVVTAIATFADRMDRSLVRQSNSYLAADRVVKGRFVIPQAWREQAKNYPLQQADIAEFSSMVFAINQQGTEEMQLASVKAVSAGYPLRGQLEISDQIFALGDAIKVADGIPESGTVWVDSRLLPLLNLNLGDQLAIGEREFTITHVVIREPDATNDFSVFGPRVLMNLADLASTNVVLPGSRVNYRWLLAGDEAVLTEFAQWLEPELGEHHSLVNLADQQRNIAAALRRGANFLMLAGIIGVLLAGVAIAIASQQFARRHIDQVALMKSLGASANQVRFIYFIQLLILGLLAAILGIVLGEFGQRLITASIASLFNVVLLPPAPWMYGLGLITGLVCLLCFALPPLWYLPTVSPLKVIRRELTVTHVSQWIRGVFGALAVIALIGLYSRDVYLISAVVLGLSALLFLGVWLASLLLYSVKQFGTRAGSIWRLATANLRRYRSQSITQIIVFACALMLLMVLLTVRTTLIDEWRLQIPDNAPNHFVLNIAPHERAAIEQLFKANNFTGSPLYPMILGRLTGKNDYSYREADRDLSNALQRELNLSWAAELADDNRLVAGVWWDQWNDRTLPYGVSVEQQVAEELAIKIGDILSFSLGGLNLQAEVVSIREVNWDAMVPNFYFLFSPGALDAYSPNYLTSLYIPPEQKLFINQLLRDYPTIVVLEVDRIIERIRNIVQQISRSIELVLWLVLIGGIFVLIAAVNASMSQRLQEAGILRVLGGSRRLILGSLGLEFALLGFFAGVLAVLGAESLLLGLQVFVFEQPLSFHWNLWLLGPISGAVLIGLLGLISCYKVVAVPPGIVLRAADNN